MQQAHRAVPGTWTHQNLPRVVQVAIKFLERGEHVNEVYVAREIIHHSQLRHPHIVQYKEAILTSAHLGIVMARSLMWLVA